MPVSTSQRTICSINLVEDAGITRSAEPIAFGVPLARGIVSDPRRLMLMDSETGALLVCGREVLSRWPDGSVSWCLFRAVVRAAACTARRIAVVVTDADLMADTSPLIALASEDGVRSLTTDRLLFRTATDRLSWSLRGLSASADAPMVFEGLAVTDADGNACVLRQQQFDAVVDAEGVSAVVSHSGEVVAASGEALCRFHSRMELIAGSTTLRWQIGLHNPRAAEHPGGLWDLGDPGSVYFREVAVPLAMGAEASAYLQLEAGGEWIDCSDGGHLLQASSGGDNWLSSNHVDRHGDIKLAFRGYRLDAGESVCLGLRAEPIVALGDRFKVHARQFWQQFPKAVQIASGKLAVKLFPAGSEFELQAGEKKTHLLSLDCSDERDALAGCRSPLGVVLDPAYIEAVGCIPYFSVSPEHSDTLIGIGLSPLQGFVAKREWIDEYGWRNFGDVVADHESLYLAPPEMFVSHYNNQYDTVYGFVRQYLRSGDTRWWVLADDLARHITDIDIYHTRADRAEYNGGLFWHTDHYVDACTATHRTYSRSQKSTGGGAPTGGGPGPEHCYSLGLLLHHFLTGSSASRDAVLSLGRWMTAVYEGSGTVIETLLAIRARLLPQWRHCPPAGVLRHSLPMNRGVGNYINAILDCFVLTAETCYLLQVESIIRRTVHPGDRIEDRHFDDVELTWHYTVFLQAAIRYIEVKRQHGEGDDAACRYALACVFHYAVWMRDNEVPYLECPERLEFPNDTWIAQDIRKAHILFFAGRYAASDIDRAAYRARATEFYDYVVTRLGESETRHFSRILGIVMQNHGPSAYYAAGANDAVSLVGEWGSPYASRVGLLREAVSLLGRSLLRLSPRRELQWLAYRSGFARKLYRRLFV